MRFLCIAWLIFVPFLEGASPPPNIIEAGPEVFYIRRMRSGGTKQTARMDGVYVEFDRLKRYGWYVGGEFRYSQGRLKGHSGTQREILSILTDRVWEGRFGYTLQRKNPKRYFITPYGGYGYFDQTNDFLPPTPIPLKFQNTFNFVSAGFLSGVNITSLLTMWVNFKMKFMLNGASKVSEDPLMGDNTLQMNNEVLARIEVPFIYSPSNARMGLEFVASPFYEYWHFGGRQGFPFDYIDTKYNLYGANFALRRRF
ncbi:MAG: hypothetical protein H7A36_04385 [Chlamydiales bacterium]|nr:hypothetical protein [Chlamydiales bacterium]